jgi:ferritin
MEKQKVMDYLSKITGKSKEKGGKIETDSKPEKETEETTNDSSTVYKMINDQIAFEYYSMYVYHHLANFLDSIDYIDVAEYFQKKGDEELTHARKLVKYMYDRNEDVVFQQIKKPELDVKDIADVFNSALSHEQEVSKRFTEIQKQAEKENDRITYNFLNWFLVEQIEEEGVLNDYISKLKLEPTPYLFNLEFTQK